MTTIKLSNGDTIEICLSSTTAAPGAPKGTISGRAFTTWFRITREGSIDPWRSFLFGCYEEELKNIAENSNTAEQFVEALEMENNG